MLVNRIVTEGPTMSLTTVGRCWNCGKLLSDYDLGREARCSDCKKPVHSCLNCRFFQPGRSNDCMEPIAAFVTDKINANFCDYFQPHESAYKGAQSSLDDLRNAAENLFKSQ